MELINEIYKDINSLRVCKRYHHIDVLSKNIGLFRYLDYEDNLKYLNQDIQDIKESIRVVYYECDDLEIIKLTNDLEFAEVIKQDLGQRDMIEWRKSIFDPYTIYHNILTNIILIFNKNRKNEIVVSGNCYRCSDYLHLYITFVLMNPDYINCSNLKIVEGTAISTKNFSGLIVNANSNLVLNAMQDISSSESLQVVSVKHCIFDIKKRELLFFPSSLLIKINSRDIKKPSMHAKEKVVISKVGINKLHMCRVNFDVKASIPIQQLMTISLEGINITDAKEITSFGLDNNTKFFDGFPVGIKREKMLIEISNGVKCGI